MRITFEGNTIRADGQLGHVIGEDNILFAGDARYGQNRDCNMIRD